MDESFISGFMVGILAGFIIYGTIDILLPRTCWLGRHNWWIMHRDKRHYAVCLKCRKHTNFEN